MFGLRLPELLLILLVVVLLFGANKLPQLGQGLGETIRGFRKALREGHKDEEGQEGQEAKAPAKAVK
jgi:sec-independent protein translocase protein TatA